MCLRSSIQVIALICCCLPAAIGCGRQNAARQPLSQQPRTPENSVTEETSNSDDEGAVDRGLRLVPMFAPEAAGSEANRLPSGPGTSVQFPFRAAIDGLHDNAAHVAISPDGRWVVADNERRIAVYDTHSGDCVARTADVVDPINPCRRLAWSPDGRWLAAALEDGQLLVWDAATGRLSQRLKHESWVRDVDFADDGKRLATFSGLTDITVWRLDATPVVERTTKVESGVHQFLAMSPNGRWIATGGPDHSVLLIDGGRVHYLEGHSARVNAVAFASDGRLASVSDKELILWDSKTRQSIRAIAQVRSQATLLRFACHGDVVVSIGREIECYSTKSGELLSTQTAPDAARITDLALSANERLAAIAVDDRKILLADVVVTGPSRTYNFGSYQRRVFSSPDGKTLLYFSTDGEENPIALRDAESGKKIHNLKMLNSGYLHYRLSPNGGFVATVDSASLNIFDSQTGEKRKTLDVDPVAPQSMAISHDGEWIAVGASEKIELWSVKDNKRVSVLTDHRDDVCEVEFSPDGQRLIACDTASMLIAWDLVDRKSLYRIRAAEDQVRRLDISPDGQFMVTTSTSGADVKVRCWRVADGGRVWESEHFPGERGVVALFSADGKHVVSLNRDGALKVFDTATGEQVSRLNCFADARKATDLAIARKTGDVFVMSEEVTRRWPFSSLMVSGANSAAVIRQPRIALETGRTPTAVAAPTATIENAGDVNDVALSPNGELIAAALSDGAVKLSESSTTNLVRTINLGTAEANHVVWHPAGDHLIVGCENMEVRTIDLKNNDRSELLGRFENPIGCLAVSPDGRYIAAGEVETGSPLLLCWDFDSRRVVNRIICEGHVGAAAFSPNGKVLAVGVLSDVHLIDVGRWKTIQTFQASSTVNALAFSSDSKLLAAGTGTLYRPSTAHIWDTTNGNVVNLIGHERHVDSLTFTPDDKMLLTASFAGRDDGLVRFWDAASGKPRLRAYPMHREMITAVTMMKNGKHFITGGEDKELSIWSIDELLDDEFQRAALPLLQLGASFRREGDLIQVGNGLNGPDSGELYNELVRIKRPLALEFGISSALDDGALTQFAPAPAVRRLSIDNVPYVTNAGLKRLAGFTNLEELHLHTYEVGNDVLESLTRFPKLNSLTITSTKLNAEAWSHLGSIAGLTSLEVHHVEPETTGLEHLKRLKQLKHLTLDFHNDAANYPATNALRRLKQLKTLNLKDVPQKVVDELSQQLAETTVASTNQLNAR